MANILINNIVREIAVLVLDKDGTLIDFHKMWGPRMEAAAEAIVNERDDRAQLLRHLYHCVGYNKARHQTLGQGPLATAPIHELETVVTAALYQWGIPWENASELTTRHFTQRMSAPPTKDEVNPRGPVLATLQSLHQAGVHLVVATTDNRAATEMCLEHIRIRSLIDTVVCGDDNNSPVKPDPAVLLLLAEQFGVKLKRFAMVGDTVSDLRMAQNAGAGYAVGITGGAEKESVLRAETSILINSLEEIRLS